MQRTQLNLYTEFEIRLFGSLSLYRKKLFILKELTRVNLKSIDGNLFLSSIRISVIIFSDASPKYGKEKYKEGILQFRLLGTA